MEVRTQRQIPALHDAKEGYVKNPRKLLEEIKKHVAACPLGYYPDTTTPLRTMVVCTHRSTTSEDVVKWLEELQRLAGTL